MNSLFFEILIAPDFTEEALEVLKTKKNRILLKRKAVQFSKMMFKTLLNGVIEQDKDLTTETTADFKTVTKRNQQKMKSFLLFAQKCVNIPNQTPLF